MKISDELKKQIAELFKVRGLDVAEDMAVLAVTAAFDLLILIIPKVSAGLGAIIVPMVEIVKPKVLELLDAIDGKDDPGR